MSATEDGAISLATAVSLEGLQAGISSIEANIAAMEGRLNSRIKGLGNAVDKASEKAESSIKKITEAGGNLGDTFDKVSKAAASIGVAFTAQALVSQIVNIRGEFQKLEVAFNTMLGSEEQANALMQQLIQTAATTPFDLQGVANGAKQLLAYGENVENVNDDLIRLGNIAAGLSQPLGDIVYLYGTTMTQGRLYTQDLNQFTGRGVPMIRELANVMGVAENKVKDLVEEGKIGFPEVQKVIQNLTNEGGMFYNLMEEQSKTISGQIANIEDAVSMMFNEIGQKSEGIINSALDTVSSLIENYEQVGRLLLGLVATYGTYRAACMLVAAAHTIQAAGVAALTTAEAAHYGWLVIVEKAQKLLNATMLSNPYVLVATLIAGVVAALMTMKTETERMREAEQEYQDAKQETINKEEEHIRKMNELCDIAGDEAASTDIRREALNKLEMKYPDIFAKYETEYEKLKNIKKIKEEIAALEAGKSITNSKNELSDVEKRIKELEKKKATETYNTYTISGGAAYTVKSGGLSTKEEAEYKNLLNKRKNLQKQVKKDDANNYFANLTGISNADLQKMITERTNLLAKMSQSGKKYGTVRVGDATQQGVYNANELKYQLNKLKSEQNSRKATKDSSADWGKSARQKYQEALKEYNDFLNNTSNKLTQAEYEKKRKELKDALDTAKKEYDASKPSSDKDASKTAKKEEQERKKEEEAEKKRIEKKKQMANELVQIEEDTKQAEIDAMEDGIAKKLAMIDLDYTKQKDKLNKQETDWKSDNKEAGVSTEDNGLTKEQSAALEKARKENEAKRKTLTDRALKEEADAQAEAMNNYYIQYGTMQEKILALTQQYERKKKDAKTEGDKLSLQKEFEQETKNIQLDDFKKTLDWDVLFGDMTKQSLPALQSALDKIKGKFDEMKGSMNVTEIKDMQEAISKLEDEIASRNPFTALAKSLQDISKYKTDLVNALNDYAAAQGEITAAQTEYNAALEYQQQLEAQIAEGTLSKDSETYKDALEATVQAQNKLTTATQESNTAEKNALNARNGITKSYKNFSSQLKNVGSVISDIGGKAKNLAAVFSDDVAGSIEKSIDFVTEMLDAATTVIDAIGDTGKTVVNTMTTTAQASGQATQAAATATATAISTVEKASVILAVISAALQVATAIASLFNDDEEKQKEIERLQERIDQLQWELDNQSTVKLMENTGSALERVKNVLSDTTAEVLGLHEVTKKWGSTFGTYMGEIIYQNEIYQKSINKIVDAYTSMNYTDDKYLGLDKYTTAREQLQNLAEQQILVEKQLEEEQSKKDSDASAINDYKEKIEELGQEMQDLLNNMLEDIIGYSAEDLASELGDAFIEAFSEGEDAAEAWGEKVDDIVADIIKNMMIQEFLEKPIGELFDKYRKKWLGSDGNFDIDAFKSSVGDFSSELDGMMSYMQEAMDAYSEYTDLFTESAERTGTDKGIATASQDSVDENNARLTTIQGHTYSINQGVIELNRTSNAMLTKLTEIETNTQRTNDRLDTMNTNIRNIKSNVDEIQTKGIRIRS